MSAGCSLINDWDECGQDADCGAGLACVDTLCVTPTGSAGDRVEVNGDVAVNAAWVADRTYVLTGTVWVLPPATLELRAGTKVLGEPGSGIVVLPGARLVVRGAANAPVVMTSAGVEGERRPGDWAGVTLLGRAPVNDGFKTVLAGLSDVARAAYGGGDADGDCGALEYLRIAFAGGGAEERGALSLAGCGGKTLVDHVQLHLSAGDGVALFGGSVDLRHVVVTRAQKDGVDWRGGWVGSAQFLAVQQDDRGAQALDAKNSETDPGASPRSSPRVFNFTFVGSGAAGGQRAMRLGDGTGGALSNGIVAGQPLEAIDVVGSEVGVLLERGDASVEHTVFFDVGAGGTHFFPSAEEESDPTFDDDGGFDEDAFFRAAEHNLRLGLDPGLPGAHNLAAPGWVPATELGDGATPPPGFDESARFLGAFRPGSAAWTDGWTAYPAN